MELSKDGKRLPEGVDSEASREGPVEMCDSTRTGRIIGAKQGMTSPIQMLARARRDGHRFLLFASLSLLLLFHLVRASELLPNNFSDGISEMGSDMPETDETSNGSPRSRRGSTQNLRPGLSESGNNSSRKLEGLSSTAGGDGAQVGESATVDPESIDQEHNIIWKNEFPHKIIPKKITIRPLEKYYFRCPKGVDFWDMQICYVPFSLEEGCPELRKVDKSHANLLRLEKLEDASGETDWPITVAHIKELPSVPFDIYGFCVTDDNTKGWLMHLTLTGDESTVPPAADSAGTGGAGDDDGDFNSAADLKKAIGTMRAVKNISSFLGIGDAETHAEESSTPEPKEPEPEKPKPEKKSDKTHDFVWKDGFPKEIISKDVTIRPFEKYYIRCPKGVDYKDINVCLSPLANVTDPCPEEKKIVGDWSSVLPGWEKLNDEDGKDWPIKVAQIREAPEERVDLFVVCLSKSKKRGWSLHLSFPGKIRVPFGLNSTGDTVESDNDGVPGSGVPGSGVPGSGVPGSGGSDSGAGGGNPSGAQYGLALGLVVVCALTTLFLSS